MGSRREPDVTDAPVQTIAPAWKSATKQRASANVTCNQESDCSEETTVNFLEPISRGHEARWKTDFGFDLPS